MKSLFKILFSDKKNLLIIIYSIIISIIVSLQVSFNRINIYEIKKINIPLTLICLMIVFTISSFVIFDKKKYLSKLFKYRYLYAVILFLLIVLGKFNGCSIGQWNNYIQPNYNYSNKTIFGVNRGIRSDEWLVNSPLMLVQEKFDYGINNPFVRGEDTNIYLLSTAPVKDYIEIARPLSLGMFLSKDYGLSIWWYGRLFMLFFTSFELIRILTKDKKRISLFGAFLITGSSVVQWFFASYITEILIGGQLALICFYKLIKSNNKIHKFLWSLLLTIGFLDYCLILYPAHQIPFGYIFFIILMYILYDNKEYKIIKNNLLYFIVPIILIITVLSRFFILSKDAINIIASTVYPGKRFTNGGIFYEWQRLLQYPYTLLLPFKESNNACTISSFMCLFPLPLVLSIYYLLKKDSKKVKSKKLFVLLLTLLAFIYICFCVFHMPDFFVKYTLLSKTTVNAICAPIGLICIYLMCILFDDVSFSNKKGKIMSLIIAISLSLICIYLSYKFMPDYLPKYVIFVLLILFIILDYVYLTKKLNIIKNMFMFGLSTLCLINIICVNPINIGTDMIYKKPLYEKINSIVSDDPDSKWIALESFITPNYIMMSGAKTINSTNLYPNLKLWYKIDKDKKNKNIYNRYAHIIIDLTKNETKFELIQADLFNLKLNYKDIKKLDIKYIYSPHEINTHFINLVKIYEDDNSFIYEVKE